MSRKLVNLHDLPAFKVPEGTDLVIYRNVKSTETDWEIGSEGKSSSRVLFTTMPVPAFCGGVFVHSFIDNSGWGSDWADWKAPVIPLAMKAILQSICDNEFRNIFHLILPKTSVDNWKELKVVLRKAGFKPIWQKEYPINDNTSNPIQIWQLVLEQGDLDDYDLEDDWGED